MGTWTDPQKVPTAELGVGNNHPAYFVNQYHAIEFCSTQEGLEPCYTIDKVNKDPNITTSLDKFKWNITCDFTQNGYRRPTEAEWEYAARGGNNRDSFVYSGSR